MVKAYCTYVRPLLELNVKKRYRFKKATFNVV
jgi:hypothetical protein